MIQGKCNVPLYICVYIYTLQVKDLILLKVLLCQTGPVGISSSLGDSIGSERRTQRTRF